MERQPHQQNGGEAEPNVNSYGTDDPTEQARIERVRAEAHEQRQRDRQEFERYVAAGLNEEDAESAVEAQAYFRKRIAQQQAEQESESSPAERNIRVGLYQARIERRTIDDVTAGRIARDLRGEENSALSNLSSSGAIERDRLLQELAAYPAEGSWRVHWIDALTQYVLGRGERGPVPDWMDLAAEEPDAQNIGQQANTAETPRPEREVSAERAHHPTPRIYVACLASYNQGIHHGLWIDANQDVDELQADIDAMLASSPTVGAEEYAIHDQEGFAGFELGEHEDLALISRVAQAIAQHGEAFAAYLTWAGSSVEACRTFRQHYVGTYPDAETWAREVGRRLQRELQLEQRLDPDLLPYVSIDYQTYAQDMANHWHVVEGHEGVHVFGP